MSEFLQGWKAQEWRGSGLEGLAVSGGDGKYQDDCNSKPANSQGLFTMAGNRSYEAPNSKLFRQNQGVERRGIQLIGPVRYEKQKDHPK